MKENEEKEYKMEKGIEKEEGRGRVREQRRGKDKRKRKTDKRVKTRAEKQKRERKDEKNNNNSIGRKDGENMLFFCEIKWNNIKFDEKQER